MGKVSRAKVSCSSVSTIEHDTFARETFPIVDRHPARADSETSAVDPDDYRMFLRRVRVCGRLRRHPNVQIQAVLACCLLSEVVVDVVLTKVLDALRRLAVGVVNSAPAICRLRLGPP